jgi:predicted nucleotidyltransferase component of viral defense system
MGGTCIHIIHGSPRFSEDLDFDNTDISADEFSELAGTVKRDLELEGYTVELKTTFKGAFHAFFRFPAILHESGITGHREQKLLIELDTQPQHFTYEPDRPVISKFDVFCRIRAVPADILLAQKMSCILSRRRPMGRDFYDAAYLMGKARANMDYLKAKQGIENENELKARLLSRCDALDLESLAGDVEPFVIKPKDTERVRFFAQYVDENLFSS